MRRRSLAFLVALYPKAWRRRYAEELADLCQDYMQAGEGTRARLALNIVGSAFAQHLKSLASGRERVAGLVAVALVLVGIGTGALVVNGLSGAPSLSPLFVKAVNTQGSSNHISPAPAGDKPTVSSGRAITTALKEARGAKVVGIGLASFTSLYPRPGVLCWVVAIDRPGLHLSWQGHRSCLTSIAASITSVTASGASPLSARPTSTTTTSFS